MVNGSSNPELVQQTAYGENGIKLSIQALGSTPAEIKITGKAKLREGVNVPLIGAVNWNATLQQYEKKEYSEMPTIPSELDPTTPDTSLIVRKEPVPIKVTAPTYLNETKSSVKAITNTVKITINYKHYLIYITELMRVILDKYRILVIIK